jgi:hypothetical protein
MTADLAIINAKVITVDRDFSIKEAVAVKDGKILAVGTSDDVKAYIAIPRCWTLKANRFCRVSTNRTCMPLFSGPAGRLCPST